MKKHQILTHQTQNHGLFIRTVSLSINNNYTVNFFFTLGNNLYGWKMSRFMPYGNFKWVKPSLDGLNNLIENSEIGRIYEVNIAYPKELHDKHNDLPFLPQIAYHQTQKCGNLCYI